MAEKIKIFELDIDVDAAIKSSSELKERSDQLKESLKELKDAGDTNSDTYVRMEAEYKSVRKQYNAAQREIGKMMQVQGKEIKTVEEARNALSVVSKEWAKQANLYGANSKEADELADKSLELRNRLKELEGGVGDNRRNVGNYTESMKDAIQQSSLFRKAQQGVNTVMQVAQPVYEKTSTEFKGVSKSYKAAKAEAEGYTGAQKAMKVATGATNAVLKLFKIALISTGIGAILVALGSLVALFTKTQKGIDFVNQALAALKAGFDVIIDRAAKFGEGLAKLVKGDFAGAFNAMRDSAKGFGEELINNTKQAFKLEKQLQDLEAQQKLLDFRRAAANTRISELKSIVDDTTKSTEDRIKASKELQNIESDLADAELKNAQKMLQNKMGNLDADEDSLKMLEKLKDGTADYQEVLESLGLVEATDEEVDEFLDLFEKMESAQEKSFSVRRRNTRKQNALIKEQRKKEEDRQKAAMEAAQKATDQAIKESKLRLEVFKEENKNRSKTLDEQLKFAEKKRDKAIAILNQELQAKKISEQKYELEVLKLKNDFLKTQKDLAVQNAKNELQEVKRTHQSRIEDGELLNDQLVEQEMDRLDRISEAEQEYQQERLEQGVISREEYHKAIRKADQEARNKKEEIENEYQEQQAEAEAIDRENQLEIEQERMQFDLERQLAHLEERKEQEIAEAEATGADIQLIRQKYAQQEQRVREIVEQNKTELASEYFGNMTTIMGKESAAGKAMAVTQTTIDTYQSATAAYKAMAGIPIVGPGLGVAAAAAAVKSGLDNVKKITSTKKPKIPKAEKGGLFEIGGKRHSAGGTQFYGEDGTQFEAEEGELIGVMNRRAAMLFKDFNDANGGNTTTTGSYFAEGGFVQTATQPPAAMNKGQQPIDIDQMARRIGQEMAEANKSLPRPVTDVKDVVSNVNDYNEVVNGANI